MPQPSDLVFLINDRSLLVVALCGIVAFAFILWEHRVRGFSTRSDDSHSNNPAQKNQAASSIEPAELDASISNHDKDILDRYVFSLYTRLPLSAKEAIELELVQELVKQADRRAEAMGDLRNFCMETVLRNSNLKALLLQSWKYGSFQAFRDDEDLMSLIRTYIDDQTCKTINSGLPLVTGCLTLQETTIPPTWQEDSGKPVERGNSGVVWQNITKPADSIGHNTFNVQNANLRDVEINAAAGDIWQISYSDDHEARVASWLSSMDQRSIHNDIAKKRTDGTGDWFLESKQWSDWTTNPYRRVLWCPGIPGVGKTVTASLAVDHLRHIDSQATPPSQPMAVAFIYFSYQRRERQDLSFTIECLSRQVYEITQARRFTSVFDGLHAQHAEHGSRPAIEQLKSALSGTILHFKRFYVILDALDEYLECYSDEAIRSLLQTILSLGDHVKVMATSRIVGQMVDIFGEFGCIKEEIEAKPDDLSKYIRHRVEKADFQFPVSEELTQQVVDQVRDAAKGRFLMAELHMNSLQLQISKGHLKDALASLSDQVDVVYKNVMHRIEGYGDMRRELATRTFMWLTRTRHPLSISELQHALAIEPGRKNILDYISLQSTITGACAGLVVVEDERVAFIHFTTQEFFLKAHSQQFSHAQVASQCLDYILLPCFYDLAPDYLSENPIAYWLSQTYSFYRYAASNWGYHLNLSEPEAEESLQVKERAISVLEQGGMALNLSLWYILRSQLWNEAVLDPKSDSITTTGIFLSIYHNQSSALQQLLAKVDGFPTIRLGPTPFHFAAQFGRVELLETMLKRWGTTSRSQTWNSIITTSDNLKEPSNDVIALSSESGKFDINTLAAAASIWAQHHTVLSVAASNNHVPVLKLLLKHPEIGVNLPRDRPPLFCGVFNESAFSTLLSHPDIDVNASTMIGNTLANAAVYNQIAVVNLLLGHSGIDVNAISGVNARTALANAAEGGHESIMHLLLEHQGIDINLCDINNRYSTTPLQTACERGRDTIVQRLLNHPDIDVNRVGGSWNSVLEAAVSSGKASTVALVLKDLRIDFDVGIKALNYCFQSEESEAILDLLLADRRFKPVMLGPDSRGLTAFMLAADNGRESICRKLLKHGGTDVNSQDTKGDSALLYAVARGHDNVVQMLHSETAADINHQNSHGITALSAACNYESVGFRQKEPEEALPTVQLLLSFKDIDVNLSDVDGYTPVDYAQRSGYMEIVKLLGAKGGIGTVPIEELGKLSLENGDIGKIIRRL